MTVKRRWTINFKNYWTIKFTTNLLLASGIFLLLYFSDWHKSYLTTRSNRGSGHKKIFSSYFPYPIETIVSVKVHNDKYSVRDFLWSWLAFWPPIYGQITFIVNSQKAVSNIDSCLEGARVKPFIKYLNDSGSVEPKTYYKFISDLYTNATVIAFFDDDACLRDHVIPLDLFTPDKKIIARGVSWGAVNDEWLDSYGAHSALFNISSTDNYMINFPILVWRDMLSDFRTHVNQYVHGVSDNSIALFQDAMNSIILQDNHRTFKGVVCEFCLLLNFAHDNPKWKSRYQFDVWPTKHPLYSASQHHFKTCRKPEALWERDNDKFLPNLVTSAIFPFSFHPAYEKLADKYYNHTSLRIIHDMIYDRSQKLEQFASNHPMSDLSWYARWNDDIAAVWYRCLRSG